jgi:hypothetical protein
LIVAGPVLGCGPDFPNRYLDASETELLAAPEGSFAYEIARIAVASSVFPFVASSEDAVESTDIVELRQALTDRGDSPDRIDEIVSLYSACRRELAEQLRPGQRTGSGPAIKPVLSAPAGLPAEFAHYFAGAAAWYRGANDEAQDEWLKVLALPAAERRYRSTWAAFMLGRVFFEKNHRYQEKQEAARNAGLATQYFRQVRELTAAGFPDPLGLAEASLGREAQAALSVGDYARAIHLYLTQQQAGDSSALESLRTTASRCLEPSQTNLSTVATDSAAREVITAYLISRMGTYYPGREIEQRLADQAQGWALTLKAAGGPVVPEADRLAWLAYEGGLFALAKDWVAVAPEESAATQWISAQLALREGQLADGEKHLRAALAAKELNVAQRQRALAELGRVCLAQDEAGAALTAWIDGDHHEDAAYVAERVLTLVELRRYVDLYCPSAKVPAHPPWDRTKSDDLRARVRHLLARRLLRGGQTELAEKYFPESLRPVFQAYVADVRTGFDLTKPAGDRGLAFWRAALAVHEHGMELLGTELEPDWAIWDGDFESSPAGDVRSGAMHLTGGIWAPTPAEMARLSEQAVPTQRFHYRSRAAELAWWAAELLPNDTEETAKILNEAGGWQKNRDPQAAQRFYQALVIRCGNTALGRAAAQQRWFPRKDAQ